MRKVLFLDRDGVINIDYGYVYQWDNFDFIPGVIEALQLFSLHGYGLIIVTNQSGIGRGFYSETDFNILSRKMCFFLENHGVVIEDIFYCPHEPSLRGEEQCECRKPSPGLIMQATQKYELNLNLSVLVGDKETDIEAGEAAGVGLNVLVGKSNTNHHGNYYKDLLTFAHCHLSLDS